MLEALKDRPIEDDEENPILTVDELQGSRKYNSSTGSVCSPTGVFHSQTGLNNKAALNPNL